MNLRQERFKRIAEKRVNKLIESFRLLSNCSNRSNYEYTDQEIKKIFSAIDKEFKKLKSKFSGQTDKETFHL